MWFAKEIIVSLVRAGAVVIVDNLPTYKVQNVPGAIASVKATFIYRPALLHRLTPIDHQGSDDEGGRIRTQPDDRISDFFGLSHPANWLERLLVLVLQQYRQ